MNTETWDEAFDHRELRTRGLPSQSTWEPGLTVLYHPTYERIGDQLQLIGLIHRDSVEISRLSPEFTSPTTGCQDPLRDPGISRRPFIFEGLEKGGVRLRCEGSKTRIEVDGKPVSWGCDFTRDQLKNGVVLQLAERVVLLLHLIPPILPQQNNVIDMIGESAGMRRIRAEIKRIADLHVTVFLRGETGTGKEVAARALHYHSPRNTKKLVSVNLGALPPGVATSELFGAVRGAYTGAVRNQDGYFRMAHGGTLFLDEIGETSPDIQAMLLRVLETSEIYPVGSQMPIKVDTRIVAATDANLEERVRSGAFKAPLLHRLSGYEIWLPPLRERKDDIGRLFLHFARMELEAIGDLKRLETVEDFRVPPWIPARLMARLACYDWPGNIRQLRNVVRQLIIGSRGLPQLEAGPQVERLLHTAPVVSEKSAQPTASIDIPDEVPNRKKRRKPATISEMELIEALERNDWNIKSSAEDLRISRASLYALIKKNPDIRTVADIPNEEIVEYFEKYKGNVDTMSEALKVSRYALNRRLFDQGLLESSD